MTQPGVSVEGYPALRRALRDVEDGTNDLKAANLGAAEIVAERAEVLVPRRSGALAGSIRSAGQVGAGLVRAGKRAVPYARPIHFGWAARNIAPQPFLYDALDDRVDEVRERYRTALDDLIRKNGLND